VKRLLMLGGGHAHLKVLAQLARRPLAGWDVCVLTPSSSQIYSGMLPGWVAGHYSIDECSIDLDSLTRRAGASLRLASATAVDAHRQCVTTSAGETFDYDVLSIDTGSVPDISSLEGAREHGVLIRPIEEFMAQWQPLVERLHQQCSRFDVAVLGGGAAGTELAFALRYRGMREGWSHLHVHLVGAEDMPLSGTPVNARNRASDLLRRRSIRWNGQRRATRLDAGRILFADGTQLPCDACWVVTGPAPPAWLAASAMACDDKGFLKITCTLQSASHPNVFAAGDVASHPDNPPKSGVYAVRAGELLAGNVQAYCTGKPLVGWQPQKRALYLISTGERNAMAIWGSWVWTGRWVWRWKNRIDRRFVASYQLDQPVM
jgi:pyridine nucleotide-disulfide oxidoreductase family protein